jgi:mannosyltransferase
MNPATQSAVPGAVTTNGTAPRWRAANWVAWAVPAAVTAALGLYEISGPMLWRDELATFSATSRTLPQLWAMAHHVDAVISPYYFVLHLWIAVFGDSAAAMRVPSVLAMTCAAAAVALTVKRLVANPTAGAGLAAALAGGLLYAFIPSVTRYGQEARPYAFASMFAALAALLLLRAIERPVWHRWAWYAVALAGAGVSNMIAMAVVAGHVVVVLVFWWRRRPARPVLTGFCAAVIAAVIIDSPLIFEGHKQSLSQIGQQPVPSLANLVGIRGGLWSQLFSSSHVAYAILLLAVLSVALAPRRAESWAALACGVAPIVAVWLVSHGPDSYWIFRYMLFTVPAWAVSAGLGVAAIWERLPVLRQRAAGRYAVAGVLVAAVALAGLADQRAIRDPEAHNRWAYPLVVSNGEPVDYAGAANVLAQHQQPGDGIVYQVSDDNHYQVNMSVAYYLRGKPMPRPVFQSKTPAQADSLQPVECAKPANCLTGTPRLWVVYVNHLVSGNVRDPFAAIPPDEAAALKADGYQTRELFAKDGITVALLTATS